MAPMTERELVERLRELRQFYNERPAVRELPRMAEISVAECSNIGASFGEAADALTRLSEDNERLRKALSCFLEDPRFQVAVGGNPNVVDRMLAEARAALSASEQEGESELPPNGGF